jgi:hypothetical protein
MHIMETNEESIKYRAMYEESKKTIEYLSEEYIKLREKIAVDQFKQVILDKLEYELRRQERDYLYHINNSSKSVEQKQQERSNYESAKKLGDWIKALIKTYEYPSKIS